MQLLMCFGNDIAILASPDNLFKKVISAHIPTTLYHPSLLSGDALPLSEDKQKTRRAYRYKHYLSHII